MEEFDFYISTNGRLIIPEYNIDYLINMSESSIPTMPEAIESTAKIAGRNGDIVLSTTYQPLSFNIICYTDDNLTLDEKVEEEQKINMFLNSMKNGMKSLAIEKYGKFYDVKYSGSLSTVNYPKHIEFSIPLKSSNSFGFSIDKSEMKGNCSKKSNTIKEVGAVFTINGPALNPIISLNDYSMEFGTTILEGNKIIINTKKSTVTHINSDGVKSNAMRYYNHQFPKIQNGINTLKILSGIKDDSAVTVEWYDLIL